MKKILLIIGLIISLNSIAQIPCVVIQWNNDSTAYTVVNYNYNPSFLPVIGLEPKLEVLVKRTPYQLPDYDSRLKIVSSNYSVSNDYDLQYTQNRMWVQEFTLTDRSVEEKIISVCESEQDANLKCFPTNKQLKYLLLYTAITRREAVGLTISPEQQKILDKGDTLASKIWINHINALIKIDTLNAGGSVDLDTDWQNE